MDVWSPTGWIAAYEFQAEGAVLVQDRCTGVPFILLEAMADISSLDGAYKLGYDRTRETHHLQVSPFTFGSAPDIINAYVVPSFGRNHLLFVEAFRNNDRSDILFQVNNDTSNNPLQVGLTNVNNCQVACHVFALSRHAVHEKMEVVDCTEWSITIAIPSRVRLA